MIKIEIGQRYKNFLDEIHEIIKISPKATVLTTKNINTNKIVSFRFYNASGLYIKSGKSIVDLGNLLK